MNDMPIYLDYAATTPVDPRALDAMWPYFSYQFGNASSLSHAYGWNAQEAVSEATVNIAGLIRASHRQIVLTSGATESNNLAIQGVLQLERNSVRRHVITVCTEHKSVLDTCQAMSQQGIDVTYLPVDPQGRIRLSDLEAALRPETRLVSIMAVNNETGVIQPIKQVAALCRKHGILLHVDGTQAVGKIPVDVQAWDVDLLSFSAHKIYGPKGIGALFVGDRVKLAAIQHGGGHQEGRRSGTLPVPLIVGFGVACKIASESLVQEAETMSQYRNALEDALLTAVPSAQVNGAGADRCPGITNISFPTIDSESLSVELTTVACSSGSACTAASTAPSHVLSAMGVDPVAARSTLRLSVGRFTTAADIRQAIHEMTNTLRELGAATDRSLQASEDGDLVATH